MSSGGEFVVPIHDLDTEGRELCAPISATWLREALDGSELSPLGPDGLLDVHLSKMGRDVLVRGTIRVGLVVPCARCLDPVEMPRDIELSLLLAPATPARPAEGRGAPHEGARKKEYGRKGRGAARGTDEPAAVRKKAEDEAEFSAEQADADTYEGEEVVLDRFVREAVLLESPIFPLCSDGCKGIRPAPPEASSAGASPEEAYDPRLLPLLELSRKR